MQLSVTEHLPPLLNQCKGSVDITEQIETGSFVRSIAMSFSKATQKLAWARPWVHAISFIEKVVTKGINWERSGDLRGAGWTAQTPSLCLASLCLSLNWPPTTWGGRLPGVLSNVIATGFPASTWFSRKKDKRNCSAFSSGTVLRWCWVMLPWQIKLKFSMAWHDENVLLTHFPWQPLSLQWLWGLGCFHARAGPSVSSNFQMTVRGEMRNRGNSLALNCAVSDNHHFYFKFFARLYSCGSQPNARRWGVVGKPTNIWRILTISVPKDLIQPHFQEHPSWLFWSKRKGTLQHKNWVCMR